MLVTLISLPYLRNVTDKFCNSLMHPNHAYPQNFAFPIKRNYLVNIVKKSHLSHTILLESFLLNSIP